MRVNGSRIIRHAVVATPDELTRLTNFLTDEGIDYVLDVRLKDDTRLDKPTLGEVLALENSSRQRVVRLVIEGRRTASPTASVTISFEGSQFVASKTAEISVSSESLEKANHLKERITSRILEMRPLHSFFTRINAGIIPVASYFVVWIAALAWGAFREGAGASTSTGGHSATGQLFMISFIVSIFTFAFIFNRLQVIWAPGLLFLWGKQIQDWDFHKRVRNYILSGIIVLGLGVGVASNFLADAIK